MQPAFLANFNLQTNRNLSQHGYGRVVAVVAVCVAIIVPLDDAVAARVPAPVALAHALVVVWVPNGTKQLNPHRRRAPPIVHATDELYSFHSCGSLPT